MCDQEDDQGESEIWITEDDRERRKIDTYEYYLNRYPYPMRDTDG